MIKPLQSSKPLSLLAIALVALAGCSEQPSTTGPLEADFAKPFVLVTLGGCDFDDDGKGTLTLLDDCTTDVTIQIPDGHTLDGKGNTITAVDPALGHFTGAVVANAGTSASVTRLNVTADGLANVCDAGDDRLRGIMFDGAGGSITRSSVTGINQGPSGCQEGNAIEIRNAPFDGTHPNTLAVEIAHNTIGDYQKTGIVANGDVEVSIHHNDVGASATQENVAANSVQVGFGAIGSVNQNRIDGNQWMGTTNWVGTAVLVTGAGEVEVSQNNIRGNSGAGIYFSGSDNGRIENNRVFDAGADHPNSIYDYGVLNVGTGNVVTNNKVRGFDAPYYGTIEDDNKVIPSPHS